jgi:hypothetical protein
MKQKRSKKASRGPQVYRMLRYGEQYVDKGMKYFEEKYRQHEILSIQKKAKDLGFAVTLTPAAV